MKKIDYLLLFFLVGLWSCHSTDHENASGVEKNLKNEGVEIVVLGIAQDAGAPHIGCRKSCCTSLRATSTAYHVSCLGIIDHDAQKYYLIDATPDMPEQIDRIEEYLSWSPGKVPDGIFLTHAHIGHYTGLMYLGREALGGSEVAVYAMPRMQSYLKNDGPWSQLVELRNIEILPLNGDSTIQLTPGLSLTPVLVPHRDEYSETVGFRINASGNDALFIPDIDKWHLWDKDIVEEVQKVKYAFLDASFYNAKELSHRSAEEIPHPLVTESVSLFRNQDVAIKNRIYFIHLNHTNPIIDANSEESLDLLNRGYNTAREGNRFDL